MTLMTATLTSGWLAGRVTEVLPHGLRVQPLSNDKDSESVDAFCASAHDVHKDVQEAVAQTFQKLPQPGLPGLQLDSQIPSIWVRFQVEGKPGVRSVEGGGRAKSVQLAECMTTCKEPEMPMMRASDCSSTARHFSGIPSILQGAVEEWQRHGTSQLAREEDAFRELDEKAKHALTSQDGDEVARVFIQAVAGMCARHVVDSEKCSPPNPELANSFLVDKLAQLASSCLSELNMKHQATRHLVEPALPLCRQLARSQAAKPLSETWSKFQKCVRLRRHCSVDDCPSLAAGLVQHADSWGPPGNRCTRHGARRCNVQSCQRFARTVVGNEDEHGPPGKRCGMHAGGAKWCSVDGCSLWPKAFMKADMHGPAGYRCYMHGAGCSVPGCRNTPWGHAKQPDRHGPSGRRCWLHGGKTCSVLDCRQPPRRYLQEGDDFGPPGLRCDNHSHRCSARLGPKVPPDRPRQRALPRTLLPIAEATDEPLCRISDNKGYRCSRPPKEGYSVCEHHLSLRRRWPSKRPKQAGKKMNRLETCVAVCLI